MRRERVSIAAVTTLLSIVFVLGGCGTPASTVGPTIDNFDLTIPPEATVWSPSTRCSRSGAARIGSINVSAMIPAAHATVEEVIEREAIEALRAVGLSVAPRAENPSVTSALYRVDVRLVTWDRDLDKVETKKGMFGYETVQKRSGEMALLFRVAHPSGQVPDAEFVVRAPLSDELRSSTNFTPFNHSRGETRSSEGLAIRVMAREAAVKIASLMCE
jgi:hypothetical protein